MLARAANRIWVRLIDTLGRWETREHRRVPYHVGRRG